MLSLTAGKRAMESKMPLAAHVCLGFETISAKTVSAPITTYVMQGSDKSVKDTIQFGRQ